MIEFIEKNIFWVLLTCAGIYISFDLFKSRKDLNKKKVKKSLENFGKAIKEAKIHHWIYGFLIFLGMFLLVRGFVIVQNDSQECYMWEQNNNLLNYGLDQFNVSNLPSGNIIIDFNKRITASGQTEIMNGKSRFVEFEQGRSYNYYLRKFNSNGGRPTTLNFVCNFKLSLDRFKKNVLLDYNERGITQ